ncbi:DUF3775 domain-containing protein [Propylenella binzhouense]|uniref:DUF3775 domain-containing protein n=1 Tax=Propylenella binzhouense TaxID=2555902 RepID=A0A964WUL7_9HYPH|nr:DUF3775 domain-containing protein [Propylenella binzhouense]
MLREAPPPVELNISPDKVCYIVEKAREFDVKVEPVEPDPGSNPADDAGIESLEDYADDPTAAELREMIADLNEDEVVDLIAIAWVGRGDFERADFPAARDLAMERHRANSAPYLMGMPRLGDYLEDGFAELGHSCEEAED